MACDTDGETPEKEGFLKKSLNNSETSATTKPGITFDGKMLNNCPNDSSLNEKEQEANLEENFIPESASPKSKICEINKPLVPLKISLFLWFGSVATATPFLQIYVIQLGVTVSQLATIHCIIPAVEFLGRVVSGIIADKLGRSKPVLLTNLLLICLALSSMLLIPSSQTIHQTSEVNCTFHNNSLHVSNCSPFCRKHVTGLAAFTPCSITNETLCQNANDPSSGQIEFYTMFNESNVRSNICLMTLDKSTTSIRDICESSATKNCRVICSDDLNSVMHEHCAEDNNGLTFILSTITLILFYTFMSTCYAIMDVTSMTMSKAHNSNFGRERFWSIFSILIMSTISGYLVDINSPVSGPKNCAVAFYLFDAMIIATMVSVYKLNVKINPPSTGMWNKTFELMKNIDIVIFALLVLILGSSFYFTRIFSFVYLDQLGASSLLLGLIPAVSSLAGLPFLLTSGWWVKKIGTANLIMLGCFGYAFLCIGYSLISNPWYALIFELSPVFTYHLLWVAVIQRSHEIAPPGLTATVISTAGALHYAVGKGGGSLLGGMIMDKYGAPVAYRVIASICFASGIFYGAYLWFRRVFPVRQPSQQNHPP